VNLHDPSGPSKPKLPPVALLALSAEQQADLAANDAYVAQWLADLKELALWVPTGPAQ
jgi:hypothetical protein